MNQSIAPNLASKAKVTEQINEDFKLPTLYKKTFFPLSNHGKHLYNILINKSIKHWYDNQRMDKIELLTQNQDMFIKLDVTKKTNLDKYLNYEFIKVYENGVYPSYSLQNTSKLKKSIFRDDTFQDLLQHQAIKDKIIYSTNFDKNKFLKISNTAVNWIENNTSLAIKLSAAKEINKENLKIVLSISKKPLLKIKKISFFINDSEIYVTPNSEKDVSRILKKYSYTLALPKGRNLIKVKLIATDGKIAVDNLLVKNSYSEKPTLHLVAIGINEFPNLPSESTLTNAINDANLVKTIFNNKAKKLFNNKLSFKPYLLGYKQTTKNNIDKLIQSIRKNVKPNDYFIFYIASHGVIINDKYYFAPSDFKVNLNESKLTPIQHEQLNGFGEEQISEYLINIPTIFRMAILDTCHAGKEVESIKDLLNKVTLGKKSGISILTAAKSTQLAVDGYKGHGLFTYILAEGLNGKADFNQDNIVDSIEISQYVIKHVGKISRQEIGHSQDAVVLPEPSKNFNRRFELTQVKSEKNIKFKPNVFTPKESELYINAIDEQDPNLMNGIIRNNQRHNEGQNNSISAKNLTKEKIIKSLSFHKSIDISIFFETGSDALDLNGIKKIKTIANALNSPKLLGKRILLEGHTDDTGNETYNLLLSQRRAERVTSILNKQFDVQSSRMNALGFGELYPIGDNQTFQGKGKNRRVSVFIYDK